MIVSWNTRDLLHRAVASAFRAAEDGVALEVCVVDNASTDGSAESIREAFPAATVVVNTTNVGFGRANNQALAGSIAPFALFLNSDAELCPGALRALMDEIAAHPGCGAVSPALTYPDGSYQSSFSNFPNLMQEAVLLTGLGRWLRPEYPSYAENQAREPREVDWASGACLLVRREAWGGALAFDETFPFYVEETDLCRRLRDRGWTVRFTPNASAIHHVGQSAALRDQDQPALLWRGRLRYYAKHKPRWQSAVLRLMIKGGYLARWLAWRAMAVLRPGAGWSRRAAGAQAVLSGL